MQHQAPPIWVFFYGTIMNPPVLAEFGVTPGSVVPAKLAGFELSIRPRPNLARSERSQVFGSLMSVTHADLTRVYSSLQERFGLEYLPEAVLVETLDGMLKPALCYVAPHMAPGPADQAFVRQLASCARAVGLPDWYASHIESLAPAD